jgi:arylsulfatase A-like enzyme
MAHEEDRTMKSHAPFLVPLLFGLSAPGPAPAAGERPNIVVILADDLGYGDVACYGATKVRTPSIDRLAQEGMRFTQGHSPASVCTPSRYNLMTGRYCWRTWAGHGTVWANDPLLIDEGRVTLASLLKRAGYVTGYVGKWHLGFGRPGTAGWDELLGPDFNAELRPGPLDLGFDRFFGMPAVGQHPNIYIDGRRVVGLDPSDPIRFINDPRPAYQVDYLRRPRTAPTDLQMASGKSAELVFEECALRLTEEAVAFIRAHHAHPFFLYLAPRNIHSPLRPNARFKGTSAIGVYGDFIHELDWSVGQVLDSLDHFNVAGNTLVVFSSDNGGVPPQRWTTTVAGRAEGAGHRINGPLRGQKTEVYEGGHRVPFIVRWPGRVKPGMTSDALVANTDLLATCAEIIATPLPPGAGEDSYSFLGALSGAPPGQPPRAALVTDSMMGVFAIQEGPWKLIQGQGGGGYYPQGPPPVAERPDGPPGQLYHLGDDPGETTNRYAERPAIVARLSALLEKIQSNGRSRP